MKKLIFIDNDGEKKSQEVISYVQNNLEHFGNVVSEVVNGIETLSDFYHLKRDEKYKILYDDNTAILTWSMFTASHYNSLGQLRGFLMTAGMSDVKEHVYIDCATNLKKALTQIIENPDRYSHYFLRGLETNYIIGMDSKEQKFYRMRFDASCDGFIKHEIVNIPKLLN